MTIYRPHDQINLEPHWRFAGVKIAKLITKDHAFNLGVAILEIDPGVEIPVHVHEQELDSIYVLEGAGQAFINGQWQTISRGDYILVPKAVRHGVKNISDGILRLFVVHSPAIF